MGINKDDSMSKTAKLRRRAEELLKAKAIGVDFPRTHDEVHRLFHELQVHQVELEMQNLELRQAMDEVEKALEKYNDLFDFAPVGYLTLDREGAISAVNLSGAGMLGVERHRLIGRRFGLSVADENRLLFADFLGKVFASRGKESCEVTLTREGSSPLFVLIEALVNKSGQECRVVVIDITYRKQAEMEIERLNTDLTDRATDLATANTELEAFNYSVSHDLRRPLTAINSYCQVVQELCGNKLDEHCRGYIREMYEGTLRMDRLIETLLDFSLIKRVEMQHDKVDLSKMAGKLAMELKVTDPERSITFRIAEGIVAEGDTELLRVLLDNLIGNAWKYTSSQEGAVIEFDVTDIDGMPVFFVRDNGPGFAMSNVDKLFIPFQRLPSAEDFSGHGIGLATVERIIRRHRGKIWAEGMPGKGATFFFTLQPSRSGSEKSGSHSDQDA